MNEPVFIHSLFRAGSTYLFNVFRRSDAGYWCYQEPLNEKLIHNAKREGGFKAKVEGAKEALRHPELDKPHSFEFHVVAEQVVRLYRPEFSYRQYFTNEENQLSGLSAYFTALRDGAEGRPVFQCCRTAGRVKGLKKQFAGAHVFLWRNPWDQWWSYKHDHYFESRNLFLADANSLPPFIAALKQELNIPVFQNVDAAVKQAYFTNRVLDPVSSYKLFYALWCHAMLEAKPLCDLSINIDRLSVDDVYKKESLEGLNQLGVDGLDFSDCAVPMAAYGESDGKFFLQSENHVHRLMSMHGYSENQIGDLKLLSAARKQGLVDTSLEENSAVRDAMRAREYLRKSDTKLADMQTQLFNTRAQLQQLARNNK